MTAPVFYFRGHPDGAVSRISVGWAKDVAVLTQIDESLLNAIREYLLVCPEFVDKPRLVDILEQHFPSLPRPVLVASVIISLNDAALESSPKQVKHTFKTWVASEENRDENKQPIIADLKLFESRLDIVLGAYPCLLRQKKAERVSEAIGQPLESFDVICDLRPVFDPERRHIEAMMPVTTLRIVASEASGLPVSLEATLTRQQVEHAFDTLSKAKDKLAALFSFLDENSVRVPSLSLTKPPKS